MGLTKDDEASVVSIKVKKLKDGFKPATGESNGVKSEDAADVTKTTAKVFVFEIKKIDEECPNLAPKKASFLSFDEIVQKVESKHKVSSFIESNEALNVSELAKMHEKERVQDQIKAGMALVIKGGDDDDDSKGGKDLANSITAIKSCKAGLKKKLASTEGFLKYVEDSNKLIAENTKKMESVYKSDLNPAKQSVTVDMISKSLKEIKDQTAATMDASIGKLRKA